MKPLEYLQRKKRRLSSTMRWCRECCNGLYPASFCKFRDIIPYLRTSVKSADTRYAQSNFRTTSNAVKSILMLRSASLAWVPDVPNLAGREEQSCCKMTVQCAMRLSRGSVADFVPFLEAPTCATQEFLPTLYYMQQPP